MWRWLTLAMGLGLASRFQPRVALEEAERLAGQHPYLLLIVGYAVEPVFERYSEALARLGASYVFSHSCAFYATLPVQGVTPALRHRGVGSLPALLHYHRGRLVHVDEEFDRHIAPADDVRLKALGTRAMRASAAKPLDTPLNAHECVFILSETAFADEKRRSALLRVQELFFSLSWSEFDITVEQIPTEPDGQLRLLCHGLPSDQLALDSVASMSLADLRRWVFQHSHRFVLQPQAAFTRLLKDNHWVVALFIAGVNDAATSAQLAAEVHAAASAEGGTSIFCSCDVEVEPLCGQLIALFELEGLEMPFARALYHSPGANGAQYRAFRLKDAQLAAIAPGPQGIPAALTRRGLAALANAAKSLDVELEVRLQSVATEVEYFFEKNPESPPTTALALNTRFVKRFVDAFKEKDRLLWVYDSRRGEGAALLEAFMAWLPSDVKRGKLFGTYDLAYNLRGPWAPRDGRTPAVRLYRKEDSLRNHFAERSDVHSPSRLLAAFIDLLFDDYLLPEWMPASPLP